jgi:metal-sulfur cluster biosynthetic enzyme
MNEITNNENKCTEALEALQVVVDPEIGLNVADLGLIYRIEFDEENSKIFIVMTLTTQNCPMGESIMGAVKRVLEKTFTGSEVKLELTFDPPWNHQLISEEGLDFLRH